MTPLDVVVIVVAVAVLLVAGFHFSRRGRKSTGDFILGGRRLPWWLAGTAMVAGSTNADSPLHQCGKVRRDGLPGAWFYWAQIVGGVWYSLVFSRLWRRAEINTVVEFYAIRYAGPAQTAGRIWAMLFASLIEGTVGLALGMLAMIKISTVLFGIDAPVALLGWSVSPEILLAVTGIALALAYSAASGLLGVVAGDIVEYLLALGTSYLLLFFVYREVGWARGLEDGLARAGAEGKLSFLPSLGLTAIVFFVVQPLASLSGLNAINQRAMSLRDERQAMLSGVWRIVNHYFIRAWPWYICGLASLILLPGPDLPPDLAYPGLVAQHLPAGCRGLLFAGFLVAFMSSVGSAMHSAGAVFVNDFYRPFLAPRASERHLVNAIRLAMGGFTVVATVIALSADNVLGLLQFLMKMVTAAGFVMLLRWFWWRVNGWADFAAQALALPVTLFYEHAGTLLGPHLDPVAALARVISPGSADEPYAASYLLTIGTTTLFWFGVLLLTKPEPWEKSEAFYRRVRPYGWWGPVAARCPDVVVTDRIGDDLRLYGLGLALSLCLLFGLGSVFLARWWTGALLLLAAAGIAVLLVRAINRHFAKS